MNRNRKLERIGRNIVSGMLVTGLVFGNATYIDAKKVVKDESVYVNADADGNATKVTVSDWLKNAGINGSLEDQSNLKDITNVKGDETFSQDGSGVNWNASGDDIYYQGTTNQELPVGVNITYTLDGKDISAADILGKSGKVTIKVSYTNKSKTTRTVDGKEVSMYTPFLMATGLILPTETFSNVDAGDAKVVNEGSNNIVLGFGLPGMAESLDVDSDIADKFKDEFEITADVTNFELGNTITYASASILSDLNLDDIDTFDDLDSDINKLVDSSEDLVSGSEKLSDKMEELGDKFDDYSDGEKTLNKGINTLASSGNKLVKGVKDYTTGVDTLANGTKDYVDGAKQITDGNAKLYSAVKDMPTSYKAFSTGITSYTKGVDQLADKDNSTALTTGAETLAKGIGTLNTKLSALQATYDNYTLLIGGIKQQAAQVSDPVQQQTLLAYADKLQQLADGQKTAVGDLVTATGKESTLQTGADKLSAGVTKIMAGAAELSKNSQSLRDADATMTSSITELVSSIEKLKNGGAKLSKNDKKLLAGAKKIIKAGKSVRSGSTKLIDGAQKLKKGSNKLNKATGKVSDGIDKLGDGANELFKGMDKFDEKGIQKISDMYQDDFKGIKNRFSELLDMSDEYQNFSGIGDGMDGKVKFIIETKEIKADE